LYIVAAKQADIPRPSFGDAPPVVPAYQYKEQYFMQCIYCATWHAHGAGNGHRVAHCFSTDSPYAGIGYILEYVDTLQRNPNQGKKPYVHAQCAWCDRYGSYGVTPHLCGRCLSFFATAPHLECLDRLPDPAIALTHAASYSTFELFINGLLLDFLEETDDIAQYDVETGERNEDVTLWTIVERFYAEQGTSAHLYIAQIVNTPLIKIGISREVKKRVAQLQTSHPSALRVLRIVSGGDARALEQRLHQRYADYRQEGEWFALPADLLGALLLEHF
jgi:hypothetical protein